MKNKTQKAKPKNQHWKLKVASNSAEQIFIVSRKGTALSIEKISPKKFTLSIHDLEGGLSFDISEKLYSLLKTELEWRKRVD